MAEPLKNHFDRNLVEFLASRFEEIAHDFDGPRFITTRSEEHTSELQSH